MRWTSMTISAFDSTSIDQQSSEQIHGERKKPYYTKDMRTYWFQYCPLGVDSLLSVRK